MNSELEKLVDYALVDGYITDKEKQVLIKKAQGLGFDVDELEMILDGKLFEINKSKRPQVNKCPNCGEVLSGLSRVCPSCDYMLYSESKENIQSLYQMMRDLDSSVAALKAVPKQGYGVIIWAVIKTVITYGLYIIYKRVFKKEPVFNRYAAINEKIIISTDSQAASIRTMYGDDQKTSDYVTEKLAERDAIILSRQKGDWLTALATFILIGGIITLIMYSPKLPDRPKPVESAEDKTERHIKAGRIGKAKTALARMEDGLRKDEFFVKLRDMEIDSLTTAEDYNGALALAKQIKDTDLYSNNMETKVNQIIEKEVNSLVEKNEFDKAKERAELATYPKSNYLITSIKISESLYDQEQEKNKPKTKRKKSTK